MAKSKFTEFVDKAKDVTVQAAGKVAEVTTNAVAATQKAVSETAQKINDSIEEKKKAEAAVRQAEIDRAMEELAGTFAEYFLGLLGASPIELTKRRIEDIKNSFPIPREQCVVWADAEFDLRPSGVVCTECGVYIRSNIGVWNNKKKGEDGKTETVKSHLFFYAWEDFEAEWFVGSTEEENKMLTVEPQCRERFIETCKSVAEKQSTSIDELADIDISDNIAEGVITKVAPISAAAVESAQAAIFVEQKASINTPAGHGEMAEEAITMLDRLIGLDAKVVGRDNAKDGADRMIGNDIFIQTKYYNSARGSLEACFRPEDGMYRYMNGDTPMQLEVPKDQYERVLAGFKRKIEAGKVPGVSDPNQAELIVRKGKLTYKQAVNLTKPGTIESLTYDVLTGAVICSCAFGITFVATMFLTWRRTGDIKQAIQAGASAGIQVFGISFIQHIVVSQVARTGLANAMIAPSAYIVSKLGSHTTQVIVNGIRALGGKAPIYGAAASKHLAKVLRSNVLTSAITFTIFSIPETYNLATKKASVAQYSKNMSVLAGSIVGGAGGAIAAGVASAKIAGVAGTTVAPGVGTVIGIAGGFVGGVVGAKAVDVVGDILHEDDIETWSRLFNAYVSSIISEYMLDSEEMDKLIALLDKIEQKEFKKLFTTLQKADEQEKIIRDFITPHFDAVISEREQFVLPTGDEIIDAISEN